MKRPELEIVHEKVWATSNDVAEKFKKAHKNVIRDIENLLDESKLEASNQPKLGEIESSNRLKFEPIKPSDIAEVKQFNLLNFEEITYTDPRGREQPAFRMTKDGFTLLVFGFEGILARLWKIKYIHRFNEMESTLRRRHYRRNVLTDQQIERRVQHILEQSRSDFSLTFAYNLLIARGLHIPPISQKRLARLVESGVIEGYKENRQWHVYQDSFGDWMERRKLSA